MLDMALKAKLPLVRVQTDDLLNVERILSHLVRSDFKYIHSDKFTRSPQKGDGSWLWAQACPSPDWYEVLAKQGQVLVLVNTEDPCPDAFDAGVMPVPRELAEDALEGYADDLGPILDALGGLTLKELKEVAVLAMSEHGRLSPQTVVDIRRQYVPRTRGLYLVDTQNPLSYKRDPDIEEWLAVDGEIWTRKGPKRLMPKGLLFTGIPGTGKTMGAKHIARELEVPLYRLDLGAVFQRYVGDSEENFRNALAEVDRAEPCVLLIDEVEKAMRTEDDHAVASRILGSLLWWMQERTSQVLVILTTNDEDAIPQELIRHERIDKQICLMGLSTDKAIEFAKYLMAVMRDEGIEIKDYQVTTQIRESLSWPVSYAEVTSLVHDIARKVTLELEENKEDELREDGTSPGQLPVQGND